MSFLSEIFFSETIQQINYINTIQSRSSGKISKSSKLGVCLAHRKLILKIFNSEVNGMSCAPSWTKPEDIPYNIYLFTFGFFLPLLLIIWTSAITISEINRSYRNIENDDIKTSALARQYKVVKMVCDLIT